MAENDKYVIEVETKTNDAQKKLEGVAKATKQVGSAAKATSQGAAQLASTVGMAAEAASSMGGAFGGAGRAVALFGATLRALKLALAGATGGISLFIGAIGTAIAVVVNLFQKQKEELKQFDETHKKATEAAQRRLEQLNQAKLDNLSKQYTEANAEASHLLSTTNALAAANRQWLNANLQRNLALIDRDEQEELAGAVGDARAQEDIKAKYAERRARVQGEHAIWGARQDLDLAQDRVGYAQDSRDAKASQLASARTALERAQATKTRLAKRQHLLIDNINAPWAEEHHKRKFRAEKLEVEADYAATLKKIKALEAMIPPLERELDALSNAVAVAERNVTVSELNLESEKTKASTAGQSLANESANRRHRRAEEDAAKAEKEKKEAEEKAAAEKKHLSKIAEADRLAEAEALDVTMLESTAQGHRVALNAAQGSLQRARTAHANALQAQTAHRARRGSLYDLSSQKSKDDGLLLRTAEAMRKAEENLLRAADAAEKFFKTFDAALKREQGEAERAALRAKAARETN